MCCTTTISQIEIVQMKRIPKVLFFVTLASPLVVVAVQGLTVFASSLFPLGAVVLGCAVSAGVACGVGVVSDWFASKHVGSSHGGLTVGAAIAILIFLAGTMGSVIVSVKTFGSWSTLAPLVGSAGWASLSGYFFNWGFLC